MNHKLQQWLAKGWNGSSSNLGDVIGHSLEASRGVDVVVAHGAKGGPLFMVAIVGRAEVVSRLNPVAKLASML
jgi:hypothetical protein